MCNLSSLNTDDLLETWTKVQWFIDFQDQAPFDPEKIDEVVALRSAETEKRLAAVHGRAPQRR